MNDKRDFLDFIATCCDTCKQQDIDFWLRISAPGIENIPFYTIVQRIQQCDNSHIDVLLEKTKSDYEEIPSLSRPGDIEWIFELGYRVWRAYKIFQTFTMDQLSKVLPIEPCERVECLQSLEKTQELLHNIDLSVILKLQESINHSSEDPKKIIQNTIGFQEDYFYLYNVLSNILSLDRPDLEVLHCNFPQLEPLCLVLLTNLAKHELLEAWHFKGAEYSSTNNFNVYQDFHSPESSLTIEITEQPPERCVYKRNVKPHPTVIVRGKSGRHDVYIHPVLIRCDTGEVVDYLLAKPVKAVSNKVFPFKKLKITQTSHQNNETLFSIRFELRVYHGKSDQYNVIHSASTNPICVLSHTTQLKPSSLAKPSISEIIPNYGPINGGTRVVILGANFIESPTLRVRFGNIEVYPIVHGPKTLICLTPQNQPGTVPIHVCNDVNVWSDQCGSFTYRYEDTSYGQDSSQMKSSDGGFFGHVNFEGGMETLRTWE